MNEVIDLIDIDKINKSIETMQKSLIEHNEDTIYGYGYLALINKLDGFKTNMNMMYDEINCLKEKINKAIEYIEINKRKDEFLELNEWQTRDLLKLLKEASK